jgi:hypothetical protein
MRAKMALGASAERLSIFGGGRPHLMYAIVPWEGGPWKLKTGDETFLKRHASKGSVAALQVAPG